MASQPFSSHKVARKRAPPGGHSTGRDTLLHVRSGNSWRDNGARSCSLGIFPEIGLDIATGDGQDGEPSSGPVFPGRETKRTNGNENEIETD